MTTSSVSDKTYAGLAGDQRFRAMIAAASRKDGFEMDRLVDTCPRLNYRMPDADFKVAVDKFVYLAQTHNAEMLRAVVAFFLGLEMRRLAEAEGVEPPRSVEALQDVGLAAIRGKADAWAKFCELIGLEPAEVRQGFGLSDDDPATLVLRAAETLIDDWPFENSDEIAQSEERYLAQLNETWGKAMRVRQW